MSTDLHHEADNDEIAKKSKETADPKPILKLLCVNLLFDCLLIPFMLICYDLNCLYATD